MAAQVTLHIGLPKTGTTAIQRALAGRPEALRSAGFTYPVAEGRHDHCAEVADLKLQFATPQTPDDQGYSRLLRRARPDAWRDLVRRVRSTDERVLISNEAMSSLPASMAARIIDQLTGQRPKLARVVLVVRPLSALLPSAYGQMAQDTVVPSFELWTRAWLHTKIRQLESPTMDDWTNGFSVARNWSASSAEVVCARYSSESDQYLAAVLDALGLAELIDEVSLDRANPSMSALGLAAWQRFLRTGVDPFEPDIKRLRKAVHAEMPEMGQVSVGGRLLLAPDVSELVDAAFPQPPPGVVSARQTALDRAADARSAIVRLAQRLQQDRPLTVDVLSDRAADVSALAERIAELNKNPAEWLDGPTLP